MGTFGNTFGSYYVVDTQVQDEINTIYIDPTNKNNNRNGNINNPYNSFSEFTIQNNYTYKLKNSTTYISSDVLRIDNKNGVKLSTYGNSEMKPKFQFNGYNPALYFINSSNCEIDGWEISGSNAARSLITSTGGSTESTYNKNILIKNCILHTAYYNGTKSGGFGIETYNNDNLKILNCEIFNIAVDGIYARNCINTEIGNCNLHNINQLYETNKDQTWSSGDGIQLDGQWDGFYIHHNIIDRSDSKTGNKSGIILNSAEGVSDNSTGIIEYNIFKKNNNVNEHLLISRGLNIIVRYNIFKEDGLALNIQGKCKNTLIHNNIFYGCGRGIMIGYSSTPKIYTDKIYNNVFYGLTGYNPYSNNISPAGGFHIQIDNGVKIESKNNIHVRTTDNSVSIYKFGTTATTNISNNCYDTISTAGKLGTGINSIIDNPLFVDSNNKDFHLLPNSPCINTGINVGLLEDFDGTSIPQGNNPDIGCYEFL